MAVNEKPIYAETTTCFGGKLFKPGTRMDDKGLPPYTLKSAMDTGVATDSASRAKAAGDSELARREQVKREIETRSEKRDYAEREAAFRGAR